MNTKIKILILEDSKSDAELLHYELKRNNVNFVSETVLTREDFETALDIFCPDIILSDYSLPSFDGVTAFNIKQTKYPDVPFIIVSGTIGEENAIELIKSGVTDYLLKDKLFTLNAKITRALAEATEKKEKRIADERLKKQYEKLLEIAHLQSHQVRAPIANILGLINIINFENPNDSGNTQIILKLQKTAIMFDNIIHEIVRKTHEIETIQ